MIERNDSSLSKVVLARSTRVVPTAIIDPLTWLACLKVEGDNFYQFFLQPPNAPAFIGNTPEQLFHRKGLHITSDALAATRARGVSLELDPQIELDLLTSLKDDIEFTIVRETIRRKLELDHEDDDTASAIQPVHMPTRYGKEVNYENDMKPLDASSSQPLDELNKSTQNLSLEDKAAVQERGIGSAQLL